MRRTLFAVVVSSLLVATGCASGDPTATPRPTAASDGTSTPRPSRDVERIEVRVADGEVEGGAKRHDIKLGSRVEITVHSDVTDEVHVHGYDETAAVTAGSLVSIGFIADTAGVFTVELEERKIELLELAVR